MGAFVHFRNCRVPIQLGKRGMGSMVAGKIRPHRAFQVMIKSVSMRREGGSHWRALSKVAK
jgi:hypothetical protein